MLISKNTLGSAAVTPASGKTNLFMNEDGVPSIKDSAGAVSTLLTEGEAGDSFQPLNANLTDLSALTPAADHSAYYNGTTWATYSLTAVGRTFLAATTQAAQQTALGLGTAATYNVGNGTVGAIPVISAQSSNTSLSISASVAAAVLEGVGGTADGDDQIQMQVVARATAAVANTSEKRICFMGFTTNGPTAGHRGGAFYVAMKGDNTNTLTRRFYMDRNGHMQPGVTNVQDIGQAAMAWRQIYAQNTTISTSDARLKTEPRQLRDAEFKAASAIARLPAVWRWIHRVEGDENCEPEGREARKHFGPTVQAAIAVMEAHGLDPFAYSFICYDEWGALPEQWHEWPSELDDDGNVIREAGRELLQPARAAGDRYSFRKEELLCFLVAAMARQHDELAERVAALEAKLTS